jgi:glycosyltransferase involved in cell wall biosynthesis
VWSQRRSRVIDDEQVSPVPVRPLSSIIINNFNYGRFVGAAIESALGQSYQNVEVIVVDDGSTDESREVISGYPDVSSVFQENRGQASAFTTGVRACNGEFVFFLDADDTLLPGAVERAAMEFDDEAAVKAHWHLREMDVEGRLTGRILPPRKLISGDILPEVIRCGVPRGWGHGLGHAYRRSFLERILPVRECGDKHGADSYLCVLAPIFGTIRAIDEPLGCYRTHRTNFARGRDVRYRLERDARRYPFFFQWIEHYLKQQGIAVDTRRWKDPSTPYGWTRSALALESEIKALELDDNPFILVDDGLFGTDVFPNSLLMMECNEQYWGAPENDDQAIEQLERHRQSGAGRLIFAAAAFWWLDHYPGLMSHLNHRYSCCRRNDNVMVFDLETSGVRADVRSEASDRC